MKRTIALIFLIAVPAIAASDHTFVSSNGTNNVACSQAAPCDTFAHALGVTNPGGLIDALNAGDYGAVLIAQSVTIDGHGLGTIGAGQVFSACTTSAVGVCITSSAFAKSVLLRNVSINTSGSALYMSPAAAAADTLLIQGVQASSGSGCVQVYNGIVTVRDTVLANCAGAGVFASVNTVLENVTISNTLAAISAGNSGANYSITVRNSNLSQNTTAVSDTGPGALVTLDGISVSSGGAVISFVNNRIYNNATNGAPTQSVYQK